jgi:hypothetical protein
MDELPHRAIIDLQTARSEFGHQPPQGEVSALDPLQQPQAVCARNLLRLATAHLARRYAAGLAHALGPIYRGTDRHPELLGRPVTRQASLNRRNYPFAKIYGIRFAHPCWPPSQPAW